ncbi:MAG: hypothetical protein ISEC1_P1796 [Thiomicrorhabdus sp.]|nr:MAG: hypothetical protein ISEC1_P1796 [Thiomicrorhabdus sp.]
MKASSRTRRIHYPTKTSPDNWLAMLSYMAIFIALPICSAPAKAEVKIEPQSITIQNLYSLQQEKYLVLDSNISFNLPESVVSAIEHEIQISFKTEIKLTEKISILGLSFTRVRKTVEYHTKITTQGVNQHFVLYNTRNLKRQTFPTLVSALQTLGTLRAFPFIELSELHPEQRYHIKMQVSLDHWQLPAPLVIDSLFDDNWQLNSGWFGIDLETPKSWM